MCGVIVCVDIIGVAYVIFGAAADKGARDDLGWALAMAWPLVRIQEGPLAESERPALSLMHKLFTEAEANGGRLTKHD